MGHILTLIPILGALWLGTCGAIEGIQEGDTTKVLLVMSWAGTGIIYLIWRKRAYDVVDKLVVANVELARGKRALDAAADTILRLSKETKRHPDGTRDHSDLKEAADKVLHCLKSSSSLDPSISPVEQEEDAEADSARGDGYAKKSKDAK